MKHFKYPNFKIQLAKLHTFMAGKYFGKGSGNQII
ncbi:hypothetical protein E9U_02751 [Moraxella catarrhalis BC8]|nr:hypothetical protein E9U_02751 [Moraxella catarrhalis BC8]